jgi:hypothetical protein
LLLPELIPVLKKAPEMPLEVEENLTAQSGRIAG